ncbi:MAG TPA: excinuclease ABC subunit B [Verrucomicrobia bacterium]|nr:excinuclease ABC subunit B [Verrucomicrobiota bacterium]
MQCESCKEREATVHLTQVVEGTVTKVHLCETCAAKSGLDVQSPMSITDILLGMGTKGTSARPDADLACPHCKMKRSDFKKSGRLGCPSCYESFAGELLPLIKVMHRSDQHIGKIPSREGIRVRMSAEIAVLQQALDNAVALEHYEEAARLRDQIQQCRQRASADKGESVS